MSEASEDFTNRVAVVTGGSRGIGAGIAVTLARAGARVVVCGRDQAALAKVVGMITQAGGVAHAATGDVTREDDVRALRDEAERVYGPVSLLAACAGGGGELKPLAEETLEHWRTTLDANLTSAFLTLRTFLPAMLQARRGAIVTMSSSAGRQLSGASAPYTAAKAGLQSLTRQVAAEAAPYGVRVNAIAPSAIITDRLAAAPESVRDQIAMGFPLRRLGTVSDVAEAAMFLLGDRSDWITGVTLDVAGGRVML
ncbi:SDR family NAD(P)-dependent oxidoreductase [Labrys okinawensis]|uniref:SDR family NAD(P)-dependent oxidoreductase n=1 Tax=Labrys okinawensis TaxID=346911 RepID=UPI0039BD92BC